MIKLLLLFLLNSFIEFSNSCTCVQFHSEKEGYCASPWISKVKVVSKETDGLGLMLTYRLEHLQIFKKPADVSVIPLVLNTATEESACGQTNFKVGKEYIFAGSLANNDTLFITTCDWRVPLKYIDNKKLELKPEWKTFVKSVGSCNPVQNTSSYD